MFFLLFAYTFLILHTEAMETILSFSKSAEELLRRRKVHRDLIFKYLVKEGLTMPPTSEKHQLVKRTLELWSSVTVGQGTMRCYSVSMVIQS